jgi:hypothetical protein
MSGRGNTLLLASFDVKMPSEGQRRGTRGTVRDRFERAVAEFAEAYADQTERDHAALEDAVESGRITAERGI